MILLLLFVREWILNDCMLGYIQRIDILGRRLNRIQMNEIVVVYVTIMWRLNNVQEANWKTNTNLHFKAASGSDLLSATEWSTHEIFYIYIR